MENSVIRDIEEGVYIINKDYEIVYIDKHLKAVVGNELRHLKCYQAMQGSDSPCKECPLLQKGDQNRFLNNQILYNQLLDCWVDCSMMDLDWEDEGVCTLISLKRVVDPHRNLFLNLNKDAKYEELFEFNIDNNEYKILYQEEEGRVIRKEGDLNVLIENLCFQFVYPTDQKKFLKFWNFADMKQRVSRLGNISEEFRMLYHDNEYRWMSYYINPAHKNNTEDTFLCFTVNIDKKRLPESISVEDQKLYQLLDPLTGLYSTEAFHKKVKERLATNPYGYGLVNIDIEHFKLFNDWYGTKEGDKLLIYIADQIRRIIASCDGIGARLGGDDFVMMLPKEYCVVSAVEQEIIEWSQKYDADVKFLPTGGIYLIDDSTTSVTLMCDRAALALNSVKGNYATRVAMYNTSMKQKLANEQEVLFGVKKGLDQREFVIYYQPQCSARTKRIIGAEALVRWNHPTKGLLPPGEFIPILETSGFISKLDYYVWEEVCRFQHDRLHKGLAVLPISVNVSRMDIYQYNITEVFQELISRYELEPHLIEIEITESAYTEDFHHLIEAVSSLREVGFTVLMDDFGSGYSSLNMLKDIEIDVLKIDMKFLEVTDYSSYKSSGILESIIQMGKWLGLHLIAEGVETKEQEDNLLSLDCEYMQGYYFYKPMPKAAFEELLGQENKIDIRGILAKRLPSIELEDLFHKDITSEAMLSNILGGIAIYETTEDDQIEIKMVNDSYYRMTGCNAVDLCERKERISLQVHPEDLSIFWDIFHRAEKSSALGASGIFRRYRLSGEVMWMHLNAFYLRKQGNKKVFYGAITDYTTMMNLQKDMMRLLDTIPGDVIELRVEEGQVSSRRIVCAGLAAVHGYERSVYQTLLAEDIQTLIDPRDFDRVKELMTHPETWNDHKNIEYRTRTKDGSCLWIEQRLSYIDCEEGVDIYNSLSTDITLIKNQEIELMESQEVLQKLLGISSSTSSMQQLAQENKRNAAYLFAQTLPGGMIGGYCEEGFPIYFANDEIIRLLGYASYQDLVEGLHGYVENTIHPDDREKVNQDVEQACNEGDEYTTRYRMIRKDGSWFWVIDKGRVIKAEDGRLAIISSCLDINETMDAKLKLEETREDITVLNSLVPGGYHQCICTPDLQFTHVSERFLEMLGFSMEDLQNKFHNGFLNMVVEEDRERVYRLIQQNKQQESGVFSDQYRMYKADGILWVRNQMRLVNNDSEHYFAGIIEDISESVFLEERMAAIVINTPGDVFSIEGGDIIYHSYNLASCMGCEKEEYKEIIARTKGSYFTDPRDRKMVRQAMANARDAHEDIDLVFRSVTKQGEPRYIHLKALYSGLHQDTPLYYGIMIDATAAIIKDQKLKISQQIFDSIIHQAYLDIWKYDIHADSLMISRKGWGQISDERPSLMREEGDHYILPNFRKQLENKNQYHAKTYHVLTLLNEKIEEQDFGAAVVDLSIYSKGNQWLKITCDGICDNEQQLVHVIGYFQDVTAQMEKEVQAKEEQKYAQFDSLTGIYNRRMGEILIQNALSHPNEQGITAVLMVDLDDFKQVNDQYGHLRGDHVLRGVADILSRELEEGDILCRFGGDEFMIYTHTVDLPALHDKLHSIVECTKEMSDEGDDLYPVRMGLSIGAAIVVNHMCLSVLYDQADKALYQAKTRGKNQYQIYETL